MKWGWQKLLEINTSETAKVKCLDEKKEGPD